MDPWTAQQSKHLSYIAEFPSDIRHVVGADNMVADTLPTCSTIGQCRSCQRTAAQWDCPSITAARDTALYLRLVPFSTIWVLYDVSGQYPRQVIPATNRRQLFTAFPTLGHPRAEPTRRLMKERVVWPCMMQDIIAWVRDCQGEGNDTAHYR